MNRASNLLSMFKHVQTKTMGSKIFSFAVFLSNVYGTSRQSSSGSPSPPFWAKYEHPKDRVAECEMVRPDPYAIYSRERDDFGPIWRHSYLKDLKDCRSNRAPSKKKAEITSYWRCRRFSKMLDAYDKSIGKQKQTFNISKFQPRNLPSCRHDTKSHHHQRTRQGLQML